LPGSGSAILVLLLTLRSQRPTLAALSVLTLLTLFARYYYELQLTLLTKSLLLMGAGVVLVALHLVVRRFDGRRHASLPSWMSAPDTRRWLASAAVLAAALFVLHDAWKNERTLDTGRVVLIELAPVDPRSMMQGDYMRLRCGIERDLQNALGEDGPRRGDFLVRIGLDGVGSFAGYDKGDPVGDDVVRIPFKRAGNGVEILTNAWFFQEGDAALYDDARFGEFRVGNDGRVLLNAMRDEKRQLLGRERGRE
jgi:uncharacterized membrane-anchored protein